ncbi:helix-turn-helix transcriptional regulator [Kineococcus sp. SYSU DK003]|uniref:helix-turn-helix transcriptional regulator n=1 Tax=Kineococcus sp. SYSU DK003 TaxID=3383124 RepID=UPI003D7DE39B
MPRKQQDELGDLLRSRRRDLTPAGVGLEVTGRRRTAGLRREDVARLASIGSDHYARLEQGRVQASWSVLDRLARVLRLDEREREHLFALAGWPGPAPADQVREEAEPRLRGLLEDLPTTAGIVLGRRADVLAWNPAAAALFLDFGRLPERERNFVRLVFTNPAVRGLRAGWEPYARACVALLRRAAASGPDDPRLRELVADLSARDQDFERWWGEHRTGFQESGRKTFRHPLAGELVLDWSFLAGTADPGQQLVTFAAEPGSASHDGLRSLLAARADAGR